MLAHDHGESLLLRREWCNARAHHVAERLLDIAALVVEKGFKLRWPWYDSIVADLRVPHDGRGRPTR